MSNVYRIKRYKYYVNRPFGVSERLVCMCDLAALPLIPVIDFRDASELLAVPCAMPGCPGQGLLAVLLVCEGGAVLLGGAWAQK